MSDLRRRPPPPVPQPAAQSAQPPGAQELEYRLALWSTELRRNPRLGQHIAASDLPQLLQDCQDALQPQAKPLLRTVHHFACTGGTLISKCLGVMPGTWLLSEIDPLSTMPSLRAFVPTDLISLVRYSSYVPDEETLKRIFWGGFPALFESAQALGRDLVLRDHTHSQFCYREDGSERETFRQILSERYDVRSLVTVRHPLDSYTSLVLENKWATFQPQTMEEYCRRYHLFLDRYAGCEILRYEDFVAAPETEMQRICDLLDLAYSPDFQMTFSAIKLSGDSGRGSGNIGPRPRRELAQSLREELSQSSSYASLCKKLNYDPQP